MPALDHITGELQTPGAYDGQMAKYVRSAKALSLVVPPPSLKRQIAITSVASRNGLPEQTASIPLEKIFNPMRGKTARTWFAVTLTFALAGCGGARMGQGPPVISAFTASPTDAV